MNKNFVVPEYVEGKSNVCESLFFGDPPKEEPISFDMVFNLTEDHVRRDIRRPFMTRHALCDVVKHRVGYGIVSGDIKSRFCDCANTCQPRTYTIIIRHEDISSRRKRQVVKRLKDFILEIADENHVQCIIAHETAMP